jgi:hypothetical protein
MDYLNGIVGNSCARLWTVLGPRSPWVNDHRGVMTICILAYGLQKRLLMHEKPRLNLCRDSFREAESFSPPCPRESAIGLVKRARKLKK